MDSLFSTGASPDTELIFRFVVSATLGFLIGMEREFSHKKEEHFAGVRTHTLVTVCGFLAAFLSGQWGPWALIISLAAVVVLVIISYIYIAKKPAQAGGTSEIAVIISFLLGAIIYAGYILFAVIITVLLLVLLAYKPSLHLFIRKMSRRELLAIIQYVIITALILPFLPDKRFGPYDVWNLKEIWKMVVLVSGINLLAYLLAKGYGNKGMLIGGLTGGLVSSTLVTLSFSRKSRETAAHTSTVFLAIAIVSACSIMFLRLLLEVYIVNKTLVNYIFVPVAIMCIAGFGAVFIIYRTSKKPAGKENVPLQNPLNFIVAVKFAILYAVIQWLMHYFSIRYGDDGIYLAAVFSGFTDIDAITISVSNSARYVTENKVAANAILFAAIANTVTKLMILLFTAHVSLKKIAAPGIAAILIAGGIYMLTALF